LSKCLLADDFALNNQNLGQFLDAHSFGKRMINQYLLPMAAAIWSCPTEVMMKFPARSFLQFFDNHGLLNVQDRPQWETISGGSKNYIDAILKQSDFEICLGVDIDQVRSSDKGCALSISGEWQVFDEVVFACHPDQAYAMMSEPLQEFFEPVSHFEYQENIAYLHRDDSLMPKRKLAWSSWNYLREMNQPEKSVAVTYWMNLLQNIDLKTPILVTLNPVQPPNEGLTWQKFVYEHPVFDENALTTVDFINKHQGHKHIWFSGAYLGYGFHEDGLRSGVELARKWGVQLPWEASDYAAELQQKVS
jgi:predicted NAD/FAD-binding protein